MLNCREVSDRASDFLDRALPWHTRLAVRLHLLMCRACREYVRQLSLVVTTLRRMPRQAPDERVSARLQAVFRDHSPDRMRPS